MNQNIKLITNKKNWMEHTAIQQLENIANLEDVLEVVGLPDLHAGKSPIGIALKTQNRIYPHIIGNDIGCGMGLFYTGIKRKQYKQERWVSALNHIRSLEEIETDYCYEKETPMYKFGSLGGGNHFAEFQILDSVEKEDVFKQLKIDKNDVMLLVHSGSRDYGQRILNKYLEFEGLTIEDKRMQEYINLHNDALFWAKRNRETVANKLLEQLGFHKKAAFVIDCFHNFLEQKENSFIHRKGAVSSENGIVIIPGSRGSLTYIVKPTKNTENFLNSLSHGAGRKWARSLCKSRIKDKYTNRSIRKTQLKSTIICHDSKLLYEEAPEVYKNIRHVIDSLLEFELIEVVATLKPLLTFKG